MNEDLKKLLPDLDHVAKYVPLILGAGLSMLFGVGWIGIPLLLMAFFIPGFFKVLYSIFAFMLLGFFFNLLGFLASVSMGWLPWSLDSWWTVARWIIVPTAIYSVYLSRDIQTFSGTNKKST